MDFTVTSADGTPLTVRRGGRGVPVVLVHPSAGGLDSWDQVTSVLQEEFETWVYARRGYPPSGSGDRPKTFADDVADLEAVLHCTGRPGHVVGASYGGSVALHAAGRGGDAIRSMVLFEPPLFAAGASLAPALARFRELLAAGDVPAATRLFAEEVARVPAPLLDALAPPGDGPADLEQRAAQALEAQGSLHDLEAMAADELDLGRWTHVDIPVLLMQGAETWEPIPARMDALAAALPLVTRAVLPGQSHFASHTAPALFADTVRRFLRKENEHVRPDGRHRARNGSTCSAAVTSEHRSQPRKGEAVHPIGWDRRLAEAWEALDATDPVSFVARIDALANELPAGSARATFERACALDSTGRPDAAVPLYEAALAGADHLTPEQRRRSVIQLASSLRNLGRPREAVALLEAEQERTTDDLDDAVQATLALALADTGRAREAVGVAVGALAGHLPRYQRSMATYARLLREESATVPTL
jgi:pimeloyl-ACP methyl ester carboxylesterase